MLHEKIILKRKKYLMIQLFIVDSLFFLTISDNLKIRI